MYKLPLEQMQALFTALSAQSTLYLPQGQGQIVEFKPWQDGDEARLDVLNTSVSAKQLFFPQNEDYALFKRDGKELDISQQEPSDEKFIAFGVRHCDAKSLEILDSVFLDEPVDTYYQARRENGTVIINSCTQPAETCFCTAFGINPMGTAGDVTIWMDEQFLYWKPVTEKGQALTDKVTDVLQQEVADDLEAIYQLNKKAKEAIKENPFSNINLDVFKEENLNQLFDSPKWAELSKACIGCGTCTYVCPTCQCYDVRDYDTGNSVIRSRCWDSCMYSDFTMMAHGNPRKTQLERFRQRFMHKLVYHPANHEGTYSCVGCGRCLTKCPVSINIVKVIKALGVES
ncbi:4Fe-4S dicluster domain-containing protein [Clostridia bacterium OttesenSCG-928-F22]|nr:4Fe-4S dicluster domain-containing protein [Clostridia bacterium OttesenSCG-928-F22]